MPNVLQCFSTRGFTLHPWQRAAVERWVNGDDRGPYRGTLEIFTGGGKTLIALACAQEAAKTSSEFQLVVIVPTLALAQQWSEAIAKYTNITPKEIGRRLIVDAQQARPRALVLVINSAAKAGANLETSPDAMVVVDECHRAGAPTFRSALDIRARFHLGLSATPERDDVDEEGEPVRFDEQIVARRLGKVVFAFNLADARHAGWLPEYRIIHHGLSLSLTEKAEYERRSRRVDECRDRLRDLGIEPLRARMLQSKRGEMGDAARQYLAAVGLRKDLLYRASERTRIASDIVLSALRDPGNRIIIFNERIDGASALFNQLRDRIASSDASFIAIEHSKLPLAERRLALQRFRDGRVRVLVSAKSLIEGIDVPEANVGVSMASTGSVRQRIQALGRVLRKSRLQTSIAKEAAMHLLYISDTVDEAIYEKEDWSDLTGTTQNEYRRWSLDPAELPQHLAGPPRVPKPTEAQEFERLSDLQFSYPAVWKGTLQGQEYRVDTRGNVTNAFGAYIANPQGVGDMISRVRGVPGGRFIVTDRYRLVLVSSRTDDETTWYAAGQLKEPFEAQPLEVDSSTSGPFVTGSPYTGPQNDYHGRFRIRARSGGQLERRLGRNTSHFALMEGDGSLPNNARKILDAWREHIGEGIEFRVNDRWDAWYRFAGIARFLAHVPGGFLWPDEEIAP